MSVIPTEETASNGERHNPHAAAPFDGLIIKCPDLTVNKTPLAIGAFFLAFLLEMAENRLYCC